MDRRRFLQLGGVATASGATGLAAGSSRGHFGNNEVLAVTSHSGPDMAGWTTTVGDGLWTAPGEAAVTVADLDAVHSGTETELFANVTNRGVMAHNITYRREQSPEMLSHVHACSWEFRTPYVPATNSWPNNAQTLEGGIFVWDGADTRLDYGIAFQWVLNPWLSSSGDLRTWTDTGGGQWTTAGHLTPDTDWHLAEFIVDVPNQSCAMRIDDTPIPTAFTLTPKPSYWGPEIAARLGIEIISLWPGSNPMPPSHRAQFRNWSWLQSPSVSCQ